MESSRAGRRLCLNGVRSQLDKGCRPWRPTIRFSGLRGAILKRDSQRGGAPIEGGLFDGHTFFYLMSENGVLAAGDPARHAGGIRQGRAACPAAPPSITTTVSAASTSLGARPGPQILRERRRTVSPAGSPGSGVSSRSTARDGEKQIEPEQELSTRGEPEAGEGGGFRGSSLEEVLASRTGAVGLTSTSAELLRVAWSQFMVGW